MAQYLNKIVAEVSPNLYSAAKSANLTPGEATQVEQMSYTIKQHRALAKLDANAARSTYDKLDPTIQDQLKFMFKTADYLTPPPDAGDKFMGALKGVAKVAASPLIGLFKLGGQYNRLINEPYKVAREVAQGADLFAAKTWTDAWDGRSVYDQGALKDATDYFGKYDVEVAKGLLAGKTPGEIVEGYGKVDNNILASIQKAYNEPDKFKQVMDGVKYAQVSPGRDIARMLDRKPANGGPMGTYIDGGTKNLSGVLDFVYQLAVDPLTWMTGGLSKGVTKGERLANSITDSINRGLSAERAVGDAFKDPKLYTLWEKQLGPALKQVSTATTDGEKTVALENIAKNFPGWNNPEAIKALTTKDSHLPEGIVDAATAQKYFSRANDLHLLLAGRVDGISFMRNGVAVARSRRLLGDGIARKLDALVNNVATDAKALDEAAKPINEAFLNTEDSLQRLRTAGSDMTAVIDASKEIKGWKKIGQMMARSPQGLEIRLGDDAIKTASNFTARARQLLPKDMAQVLTVKFVEATADEQVVILRNLDAATMYAMGLGGSEKGEELIMKTLQDKYGAAAGFSTKKDQAVNPGHAKHALPGSLKETETGIYANPEGPTQPYQTTWAVGSLPYDVIGSTIWDIKSKKNLINAVGGATQGDMSKKLVNAWSILTLFPRLGVRSAIDEATMYILSAPTKDLRAFATREGNKMGNVSRAFTGSKAATGPVREAVLKALSITRKGEDKVRLGKKPRLTHEEALSLLDRTNILQAKAEEIGVDVAQLSSLEKRTAIADHISNMYSGYLDEKTMGYLMQAFVHSPDALNSMAASLIAQSAISGRLGDDVLAATITPSMLDNAFEQLGIKMGKGTRTIDTGMLTDAEASLAHFEKWFKMLAGNKKELTPGYVLNPADIFFRYNGLKPNEVNAAGKDMFELALDAGMRSVGFEFNELTNTWRVANERAVNAFKAMSSHTMTGKALGLDDAEIVRSRLFLMFNDMFETFHGDVNKFNQDLLDTVRSSYNELKAMGLKSGRVPSWNEAVARISLDEFRDASKGYRISGPINTEIAFGDFNAEGVFARWGNNAMDMMDKQVTGIFRQPAVMVTYAKLRQKYAGIEREWVSQFVKSETAGFERTFAAAELKRIEERGKELAEKRFTELAVREAADTILKFADNPAIRSNFAFSARTVGRYYRATEDFYRRIYRMKDVSPLVLYRTRLAHVGIEASGMIHNDQNGEPYVIMPMDNILFRATNGTLGLLTGKGLSGYHQPSFNEFTLKLRMANPSFSQDAGLPTLSGPVAGLGVVGIKNILGIVPGKIPFIGGAIQPYAQQLGESIDTFALGNIGDNMSVTKAVVPASLQRVWAILPFDEKSRQEVTAVQQAIAYNAAHGIGLSANATDQEKSDYLNNIRISAHNVLVMRNVLGLLSPVAPTTMETKGVPDYIKDTGITGLRSEFFDILNSISKMNNGDIQDPYELALATYIGKNPGKLIYTVSREDKQTKVLIKNTTALKDWGIRNQAMIKQYGEAAYIFAPQAGTFNAATYNWIQAAGLVKSKSIEKYYNDVLVAEDKQKYYDVARQEKEILSTVSDPELRARIINSATDQRDALKANNPLLTPALIGSGNNIGGEAVMMNSVEQMINNPSTAIEPGTRQRMALAIKMMREFIAFATNPNLQNVNNATELKAARRQQIEANLKDLMLGDLYVTEANRAIFKSILSFYSRDSYRSYKETM